MRRRGVHIGYWWESQKKRPLGKLSYTCVGNIKINHTGIGCGGMEWIDLTQGRDQWRALVNTVMNVGVT
jgi:hypothetical protein